MWSSIIYLNLKEARNWIFRICFNIRQKELQMNICLFIFFKQRMNLIAEDFFSLRKFSGEMLKKKSVRITRKSSAILRTNTLHLNMTLFFALFSFIPKSNISIHSSLSFTYKESYKENKQKYIESYTTLHTVP